ncbi:MAG: MFS transporter, partial [Actinomycetota bacterium]|nr:MFS transporter [Actinomycetota bacterium]
MTSTATPNHNVGSVMANAAFRGVLASNIMASIALGTSRFVFVWVVGELTDWNPATAILGIVIGLPPLLLSAWAGSLADRMSARTLGVVLFATSTMLFASSAVLLHADLMTVPVAMVCGLITAIAPAMLMPLLQALVPRVVDESVLLQAVALQNLGMTGSSLGGIFLGGAVIQAFGLEAGLWLLTAASLGGIIIHQRTPIPPHEASTVRQGAIR